jgi:hypothetical protein
VVLAMMDPARWADTLLARAATGDRIVRFAVPLVRGYGANGISSLQLPLPPPDADWRAWRDWLGTPNPAYPVPASPTGAVRQPAWLTSTGSPNAIQFHRAMTGRDVVAELTRDYQRAEGDTARFIFGRILFALGELHPNADTIATQLRDGSPLMRLFARQALSGTRPVFGGGAGGDIAGIHVAAADSATTVSIQTRLLESMLAHKEAWRTLEEKQGAPPPPYRDVPTDADPNTVRPIYIKSDGLTAGFRAAWDGKAQFLSAAAWNAQPNRAGGELWTLSAVERAGPFLRVSFNVSGRVAKTPAQAPALWYSFTSYLLMNYDGEWVIVSKSVGVT